MSQSEYFLKSILILSCIISIIPEEINMEPSQQFRGVWINPFASEGEILRYKNEESFKNNMIDLLETIKNKNMNCIIFHIRIKNDAIYESN